MAEDIERRMGFIIEQHAQFAVDIQKLQAAQVRLEASQEHRVAAQERTDAMLRALVDVNLSLVNQVQTLATGTDRRLDALINVVGKLVRRNGGSS